MDNQGFHRSRDSKLSIEITTGSPQLAPSTNTYNGMTSDHQNNRLENGLDSHLKEILEIQMRQSGKMSRDMKDLQVPYSEVPLVESLQTNCKTIHVQESPSSNGGSANNRLPSLSIQGKGCPNKNEDIIINRNELHSDSRGDSCMVDKKTAVSLPNPDTNYTTTNSYTQTISRAIQVWPTPPYRLRFLPRGMSSVEGRTSVLGYMGRCLLSQVGLGLVLLVWAVAGAAAFHYTEGPAEIEKVAEQKALVDNLVKDLMKSPQNDEKLWHRTVERYMYRHEIAWSEGGANADFSTRSPGRVWSLPGCTLFAISLITTLGFGAPVPRTSEGRAVAVVFAAVGIPLHLILVLNIGMVIAVKLQKLATRKKKSESENQSNEEEASKKELFTDISRNNGVINRHRRSGSEPIGRQAISNITREANFIINETKDHKYQHIPDTELKPEEKEFKTNINNFLAAKKRETSYEICDFKSLETLSKSERKIYKDIGCEPNAMPRWLKFLPFIGIAIYYLSGVLMFGLGRSQGFLDSLMFPLDFTVAGGVAHTVGYIRVLYGIYLEGAVVLAASTVSILQVSATKGFTDLGLKYGLLTNSR